jgi:hypothetical protein
MDKKDVFRKLKNILPRKMRCGRIGFGFKEIGWNVFTADLVPLFKVEGRTRSDPKARFVVPKLSGCMAKRGGNVKQKIPSAEDLYRPDGVYRSGVFDKDLLD